MNVAGNTRSSDVISKLALINMIANSKLIILKIHLSGGSGCPVVPLGGADESISSTGEVHTGLLEANSMAYWRTSARGNLFGPEP